MNEFFRRLRYLLNRRRFDQELANDMEFHREMAAREGRPFGNTLLFREEARDAWGWTGSTAFRRAFGGGIPRKYTLYSAAIRLVRSRSRAQ